HGEEPGQGPRGLARYGLAASGQLVVLVGGERFPPAAVGILPLLEPADGALHVVLAAILANDTEPAQHGPGAVHVVHAPPSVPGAALMLAALDETQCALSGRMLKPMAERSQELKAAPGEIL